MKKSNIINSNSPKRTDAPRSSRTEILVYAMRTMIGNIVRNSDCDYTLESVMTVLRYVCDFNKSGPADDWLSAVIAAEAAIDRFIIRGKLDYPSNVTTAIK